MERAVDLVVIRGAPGIGKTTIGKLFQQACSTSAVIDVDQVRRMAAGETFTYGENLHYYKAVAAATRLVESFLESGYLPVVVTDVFSTSILQRFRQLCGSLRMVIITLYCEDSVLARRMARRPSGYINVDVAIRLNRLMKLPSDISNVYIDTTSLNPEEVLAEISKFVPGSLNP